MTERTQMNFRIDADLLAAIKQKSAELGISSSEFMINAAKTALGMETMERTTISKPDALESLTARLVKVEACLEERIDSQETIKEMLSSMIQERFEREVQPLVEKSIA